MTLLLACVGMAFKDAFGTLLMMSESRVAIWSAATADAVSDWANLVVNAYTSTPLYVHGWNVHTVGTMLAVSLTSFGGTAAWTAIGDRLIPKANQPRRRKRLHPWLHSRYWHDELERWVHPHRVAARG